MSGAKDLQERIAELEREVGSLRSALAARDPSAPPGEDPAVTRLLSDRTFLARLPDIVCILDRQHRFLYINRVVSEQKVEDLLGKCMLDFLDESMREGRRAALERAWATGEVQRSESGSLHGYWWESHVVPAMTDGKITHMVVTAGDVTPRRRAEDALRASESRLRHAIDAAEMGTWSWDARGASWDDRLCRIFGIDPKDAPTDPAWIIGRTHPEDRPRVAARFAEMARTGQYEDVEFRIVRPGGEIRHILSKGMIVFTKDGKPLESYGAVFDVTEQRKLAERVRNAEKMDAIGRLTAGIAHNFNNILAIMLSNTDLCKRSAPDDIQPRLDDIAHAGRRGAEMIRGLMLFARDSTGLAMRPVDVGALAKRTIDICRTTFDRNIHFELAVAPDAPHAFGNEGQLEQALLNLFINARDAFEESRPEAPLISVSIRRSPTGKLNLRVADNGPGMDESVRTRVFEPFFTTKSDKGGTGLGLASVYAVIADHGGKIACESERKKGTTFEVELPSEEPGAREPIHVLDEGAR